MKVNDILICISGKIIKKAYIYDEDWNDFLLKDKLSDIKSFLKHSSYKIDLFIFSQKFIDASPALNYHFEWDNVAAIPIFTYGDWLYSLSSDARKDLKRAARSGLIVKVIDFDDKLVNGIMEIHNETPFRQGKYFVHYGKDFRTVKNEYSTYLDRSEFIGAYYKEELVGFVKIVYIGKVASIMEILSKMRHYDKRPTNALIGKAVEVCEQKGMLYLTYGKYHYGKKGDDSLSEFKKRAGFIKILYPRYYIPLTLKGKIILNLGLHRNLIELIPGFILSFYISIRSKIMARKYAEFEQESKK